MLNATAFKKPHKYKAKAVTVDGIRFHSQAEAKRYGELKLLARAGQIERLELQPKYVFTVEGRQMFSYIADFRYHTIDGIVVEDVKGFATPLYRLKKKLIEAQFNITIIEIPA